MKKLTLIICLTLVSGFAFSQNMCIGGLDLNSVYFTDKNTGYAVGGEWCGDRPSSSQIIIKTINGGTTWDTLSSGTNTVLNSVFFTDYNNGYAVGENGTILKTSNKGATWDTLSSGVSTPLNSVFFTDLKTGYVVGGVYDIMGRHGNKQIIIKTTDCGITWEILNGNSDLALKSIYFTDSNIGYAVGVQGAMIKTINGGKTWTDLSSGVFYWLYSVYFTNADIGYAVGAGDTMIKTIDGGTTWNISNGVNCSLFSVNFIDSNIGYAVGVQGAMIKTIDAGTTWTKLSGRTSVQLNSVFFTDANTGFAVGENGTILKTTNGGGFPTVVENGSLESTFTVYPNPAKDFVVFDLPNNSESATIELYDIQGKKIVLQKLTETKQIAVGHLPKGLYLYRLIDDGTFYTGKLVVE